jgi:hypothetical protein
MTAQTFAAPDPAHLAPVVDVATAAALLEGLRFWTRLVESSFMRSGGIHGCCGRRRR